MSLEHVRYSGRDSVAGGCFHTALHTWLRLGAPWRIGVGIVSNGIGEPHLHAWLEAGGLIYSPASGARWKRIAYYAELGIDQRTVTLINPRPIVRRVGVRKIERDGVPREAVRELLNAWGHPWQVINGAIMPA